MFGRRALLTEIERLISLRRNVLLVGPADVGKTALLQTVGAPGVMIIDPFEGISSHRAWLIRRAMDRGILCLAAARSLDRGRLGAVGRIAWRFTVVRVPELSDACTRRLVARECASAGIAPHLVTREWMSTALQLAQGRPGVALAIVHGTARTWSVRTGLPTPAAAYLEMAVQGLGARGSEGLDHRR